MAKKKILWWLAQKNRRRKDILFPTTGLLFRTRADGIGTIDLLITADQVRVELRSLFFDGEGNKYDDATIIANIEASSNLMNMYELIGEDGAGYVLYAIGTAQSVLDRVIKWFYRYALFIDNEPLLVNGEILEVA